MDTSTPFTHPPDGYYDRKQLQKLGAELNELEEKYWSAQILICQLEHERYYGSEDPPP